MQIVKANRAKKQTRLAIFTTTVHIAEETSPFKELWVEAFATLQTHNKRTLFRNIYKENKFSFRESVENAFSDFIGFVFRYSTAKE